MNKELRKSIEAELASGIRKILVTHNEAAANEITKHISEGVRHIAKKFVKNLTEPEKEKASPAESPAPKKKSKAAKPAKAKANKPTSAPAKKRTKAKKPTSSGGKK